MQKANEHAHTPSSALDCGDNVTSCFKFPPPSQWWTITWNCKWEWTPLAPHDFFVKMFYHSNRDGSRAVVMRLMAVLEVIVVMALVVVVMAVALVMVGWLWLTISKPRMCKIYPVFTSCIIHASLGGWMNEWREKLIQIPYSNNHISKFVTNQLGGWVLLHWPPKFHKKATLGLTWPVSQSAAVTPATSFVTVWKLYQR